MTKRTVLKSTRRVALLTILRAANALLALLLAMAIRAQALEALIGLALVTLGIWLVLAEVFSRAIAWGASCFVAGAVMFLMATFGERLTGAGHRARQGERE